MNSLDPRVNRLPTLGNTIELSTKTPLDQFGTFEVFVKPKDGKPFQHEGIVHAPNLEMAFVLAKESFTRRFLCVSLFVVDTQHVYVSPMTEGDQSAWELIPKAGIIDNSKEDFEIFMLLKRGKQHIHLGTVQATSPEHALQEAKLIYNSDKVVFNLWAIRTRTIRFTKAEEKELWLTLPEKKFRDASDYKGGDKLKEFLERMASSKNQEI